MLTVLSLYWLEFTVDPQSTQQGPSNTKGLGPVKGRDQGCGMIKGRGMPQHIRAWLVGVA